MKHLCCSTLPELMDRVFALRLLGWRLSDAVMKTRRVHPQVLEWHAWLDKEVEP